MENNAFAEQVKQNIQALVVEGRFEEALSKCEKYISSFPDQKEMTKIKKTIEKRMQEKNAENVERKNKEAMEFYSKKDYLSALKITKEALELSPQHEKSKRLFIKYQEAYKKQIEEAEKKFFKQLKERFQNLLNNNEIVELIEEIRKLEEENSDNKEVLSMAEEFKEKIIALEIKNKKDLINSNKIEDIENFIFNLKKINKNSKILIRLENAIKQKKLGVQIENIDQFIYEGIQNLSTLIKLKKFEESIAICEEILSVNPSDKKTRKILKEAKNKLYHQSKRDALENIKNSLHSLKNEYAKNKNDFITF